MKLCLAARDHNSQDNSNIGETRSALADYIRLPECKRLINRILTAQSEQNIKSIVVLSQFSGEGKTVFISALALGFVALLNKRVLIMDTVSQSRDESFYFQQVLGKKNEGYGDQRLNSGRIDLITTKNLNQDTLLRSDPSRLPVAYEGAPQFDTADFQVAPFVKAIQDDYDLILMDTCALSNVDRDCFDPLILAMYADASIVVTSPDSLDRDTMSSLTEELKRNRVIPLGFVVNSGAVNVN